MSDLHAHTVSFVRDTMLPEQEPPRNETGAVKWLQENLFSSGLNIFLTIVSAVVIYLALSLVLPWAFGGVWNAGSLTECREVLGAFGKSSHGGACWAVIEDRWLQLIFGAYPADLYWRPILAFLLMFVALAPVLYSESVPRQFMWFTAIYPFLATWLIWGGSFWVPLLVIAGFIVGYLAYRIVLPFGGGIGATIAAIFGALIWWLLLMPMINETLHKSIGTGRLEASQIELTALSESLPAEEAEIEAAQAELNGRISEALAVKDGFLEQIEAAGDGDVSALQDQLLEQTAAIAALRDEGDVLNTALARVRDAATNNRRLLRNVDRLEEREAELPELVAKAAELEAALPESVAMLRTTENIPDGIPSDDVDLLEEFLDVEDDASSTARLIDGTYYQLGLTGLRPVSSNQIGGFMLALIIGVAGITLSLPLGILLALGRQSDLFIINKVSVVFIEVIRGVPLIVWLFTAQLLLNYFLPPGTNFDLLLRVIIMVTLFSSAYIAEVIRGGLAALPTGQYEAADALGLDYPRSMRLIVLPQALKISIPGIVNSFIGLFKDTVLVVFIGLSDPVLLSQQIRADTNWNGIYWELFIFIGLMFFIFCYSMGRYSLYLERKLQREHR